VAPILGACYPPDRCGSLPGARCGNTWSRASGTGITADVKRQYASASVVSRDRIVFNIRGNTYRLVMAIDFEKSIVWIKWLGTHSEYDRIDVRSVEYER